MSQVVTRKAAVTEEKDKRTDSPVKDMKKKMAANAEKEKEKQPAEKADKQTEKNEKAKHTDKPAESAKQNEKVDNKNDNKNQKNDNKNEKPKAAEKTSEAKDTTKASTSDKAADKKIEKNGVDAKKTDDKEKKETEKKDSKDKKETQDKKEDHADKNSKTGPKKADKTKQNGTKAKQNGDTNGVDESDDDVLEIADDEFPELAYDEGSDVECPTPEAQSRSFTRRSQVKATRTPETPLPNNEKQNESAASEDSKVLKMNEAPSDRKLRSADSPKPHDGKKDKENDEKDKDGDIIEIDDEEPRKTDTNYSKSRVKVSPYRRSLRLHDQTTSSTMANYTGNNTTMEMDITESSIAEDSLNDSYLNGLRAIRGRRSYKQLKDMPVLTKRTVHSATVTTVSESGSGTRPTAPVVGRKRKPEPEHSVELATDAADLLSSAIHSKRMRLLDRIAAPFRRTVVSSPRALPARRNAEIVGINTDLPLTAPVAAPNFDPETLKAPEAAPTMAPEAAPAVTTGLIAGQDDHRDGKRCTIM